MGMLVLVQAFSEYCENSPRFFSSTWVLRRGWSWQWCVAEYRWSPAPATWRSPTQAVSHWVKQPPAPASAGYNATEWNHNVLSLAARYQTTSRIVFCPLLGSSVRDFSVTVLLNVVCRVGKSQGNLKDLLSCLLTIKLALKEASRYNWFYFFITAPNHYLQHGLMFLKLYPHRLWQWVKLITEAFIVPFIAQSGTAPPHRTPAGPTEQGWAWLAAARFQPIYSHNMSYLTLTTAESSYLGLKTKL